MAGAFCSTILYTSDAYPTDVRSLGLGFANVFTRLAGCLTPLCGQLLLEYTSGLTTFVVYALCSGIAAICSWWLPEVGFSQAVSHAKKRETDPLLSKP